jgi:hypothetical protein
MKAAYFSRGRVETTPTSWLHGLGWRALCIAVVVSLGAAPRPCEASVGPLYAFLVGASEYMYGRQLGLADLNYADDDAVKFGEALLDLGWSSDKIDLLVQDGTSAGPEASRLARRVVGPPTRAAISKAWAAFMQRVKEETSATGRRAGAVALLLSGHGVEFKGQPKGGLKIENTYFVPVDAEAMEAEALVDVQAMLDDLQALPSSRRWFVYDACRKSVDASSRDYAASSTMLQRLRVPEGTFLLLSCKADEASYESKLLGHGVFLHHLIDGMRGLSAVNVGGELTMTSLADYAASSTERWVKQNLDGLVQRPVLKSEGESWVLAHRALSPSKPRGAKTLSVPGDHDTIQAAVDAAADGNTIRIGSGEYREAVSVEKALSFLGVGAAPCTLLAPSASQPALTIAADGVVQVEGLTVKFTGPFDVAAGTFEADGVEWDQSMWMLRVKSAPPGSRLARAGVVPGTVLTRVDDVQVLGSSHILEAYYAKAATETQFDLTYQFADGRRVQESNRMLPTIRIVRGDVVMRRLGIESSTHVAVFASGRTTRVTVDDSRVVARHVGIVAATGAQLTVTSTAFSGPGTTGVRGSGQGVEVDVSGCAFEGLTGKAIYLIGALRGRVSGNRASNCGYGLFTCGPRAVVDAVTNVFSGNTKSGVFYTWGTMGLIEGNTCEHNKSHGIDTCGQGTDPRITANTCRFNGKAGIIW